MQRGFTLVELIIALSIFGVISLAIAPVLNDMVVAQSSALRERGKLNDRGIAQALLQYAATQSATGTLPNPYTNAGGSIFSAPLDPANTALAQTIQQNQVSTMEANDDGRNAHNVRVYQLVTGLTQNVPLYAQSGPLATLTFQYGVVYATRCAKADASCNKAAWPRVSAQMTSANYTTWMPTEPDFGEAHVSSLPLQKQMLAVTAQRLDRLRDAFQSYFRGRQIVAASDDATNFYPNSTTSPATAVGSASSNQGCWYQWIDLYASDVFAMIGLTPAEHGATAWGGHVEYCRSFDGTGTSSADASPHNGALRLLKSMSGGGNPDSTTLSNNIILTF